MFLEKEGDKKIWEGFPQNCINFMGYQCFCITCRNFGGNIMGIGQNVIWYQGTKINNEKLVSGFKKIRQSDGV